MRRSDGRDDPQRIEHYAMRVVAVFPDAQLAAAFVANSAEQWRGCADWVVVPVKP